MQNSNSVNYDEELFAEMASPINDLIDDVSVTEIYIDSWNRISFMRNGKVYKHDEFFEDAHDFVNLCDHLVKDVRDRSSDNNCFSLNSTAGHRFSIHTPISHSQTDKYHMTIRLLRALQMSYKTMIDLGAFTRWQFDTMLDYLSRGKNILIAGKPNSGKTTIMRCLLNSMIAASQPRFVFLEDPRELNLTYEKGFEMEVNHKVAGSASTALRFCLRNSPQILVLGEILDPDVARTFLESVEAGFSGAVSTIHSKNAQVATSRLATLAAKGSNVSRADWLTTADNTIDLVVYVSFDQVSGIRHVSELYDVRKKLMLVEEKI